LGTAVGMLFLTLIVLGSALLAAGALGRRSGQGTGHRRLILVAVLAPIAIFLAWLAMMVLVVGPSLRG